MTEETTYILITDEDILESLHQLVRSHKPLITSRNHFRFNVQSGVVTIVGNIASHSARRILTDNIPDLPGVVAVDDSALYDDETMRFDLGKLLPSGVRVRINHGQVILSGRLPEDISAEDAKGRVAEVAGVRDVMTTWA